jgi:hypothetical protein
MSTLRTLRKLLFGETWMLPAGIAVSVAAAAAAGNGFVLLAGLLITLIATVGRSARRR